MNQITEAAKAAWAGDFGEAHNARNRFEDVTCRQELFLRHALKEIFPRSVYEFGCNVGGNLSALQKIYGYDLPTFGVEINAKAAREANSRGHAVACSSIQNVVIPVKADLVLWSGVMIHIPPEDLPLCYQLTDKTARKFVLIAEYYNPAPVEVPYRGHLGLLWKRDFGGEFMDAYPHWKMIDCGFAYHRDEGLGNQDDLTWWLMERK